MTRHTASQHRNTGMKLVWLLIVALPLLPTLFGCAGLNPHFPNHNETFQGEQAYSWVTAQCDLGYRIPGTEANRRAGDQIMERLQTLEWKTEEQTFTYMATPVRNILAWKGSGPAILLGAHYDTRPSADQEQPDKPVPGANDGASGVAVLLELARTLDVERTSHQVFLAFFDAEDSGDIAGWEWIVGSTFMANHWAADGRPPLTGMILVDMVGDRDLQVYRERNSDPRLSEEIWQTADTLGYQDHIIPKYKYAMLDDHIPFIRLGIPAVDIIDFDYPYWHTTQDTPDKVSAQSLEIVGRTLEVWLESPTD